ncbi:MAG: zinc ribbon domain-containing protein [Myxococcota bacterium]|nr:zinc ribbon domain-containing protein [Myxococcota bacterium]
MKCANCASEVPDSSNFCGVCGSDVRAQRKQALSNKTMVMDSETQAMLEAVRVNHELSAENHEPEPSLSGPDIADPSMGDESTAGQSTVNDGPILPHASSTSEVDMPPTQQDVEVQRPADAVKVAPAATINKSVSEQQSAPAQRSAEPARSKDGADASLPADNPDGPPGEDGGFRETLWFMQAQNPDSIEAIENQDMRHLADSYADRGEELDTQMRQQFSLNVSDEPIAPPERAHLATQFFDNIEVPGVNQKGKGMVAGVIILAVAGILAWYFLGR